MAVCLKKEKKILLLQNIFFTSAFLAMRFLVYCQKLSLHIPLLTAKQTENIEKLKLNFTIIEKKVVYFRSCGKSVLNKTNPACNVIL